MMNRHLKEERGTENRFEEGGICRNSKMKLTKCVRLKEWVQVQAERGKLEKVCMKNGKRGPMKRRQYMNDIGRGRIGRWEDGVPSLPLTEWLITVPLPMLSCRETGHWWIARLQGDVYFVINLHIRMYLWGGWLVLVRISPPSQYDESGRLTKWTA